MHISYYERHKEHLLAKSNAYYKQNKERIKTRNRNYYQKNKEKRAEVDRRYHQKNKERLLIKATEWNKRNPIRKMLYTAKRRAKLLGLQFDLAHTDIVIPDKCPVFGLILEKNIGHSGPNSPTLDRIDAKKGYIKGNVAVISNYANSLKREAPAFEHRRIAEWMESMGVQ